MPTHSCEKGGESGYQWGHQRCYTGEGAKLKANKQGQAIKASQKGLMLGGRK